jgi:hypothetical protein
MLFDRDEIVRTFRNVLNVIETFKLHAYVRTPNAFITNVQSALKIKLNDDEQALLELLLTHALKAEQVAAGTFYLTCEKMLLLLSKYDIEQHDVESVLEHVVRDVYADDLEHLIQIDDVETRNMLHEAIKLVGLTNNVIVDVANNCEASVEVSNQYTFDLLSLIDTQCKLSDVRVLVADAYVENVAQVNTLLEQINQISCPAVFFMRGYHDEVINTLSVNWKRGTLKIIPVLVPFDLEHCNTLNDLAMICGCEMFNSMQGKLLSTIVLSDLATVKSVTISQQILIENPITFREVKEHLYRIKTKRSELNNQELTEGFYDKRIKNLSSDKAIIRLKKDSNVIVNKWQIDRSINRIKNAVIHGIDVVSGRPIVEMIASDKYARDCIKQVRNLGAVITTS